MTLVKDGIWGQLPGPALPGDITCTAPAHGAGKEREARAGWGRKESSIWTCLPAAPFPVSHHDMPRSRVREPGGRASMVLFAGEGVPSPAPSPGDSTAVRRMRWWW